MIRRLLVAYVAMLLTIGGISAAEAASCGLRACDSSPEVDIGGGQLTASYFAVEAGRARASNQPSGEPPSFRWRLRTQCQLSDANVGACDGADVVCDPPPGRLVGYYIVQRQRLVAPDGSAVDGQVPPSNLPAGSPYGAFATVFSGCVDVTDLNPPPSPEEVFRYFRELPLPQLTAQQQPPGNALVGLPVIFFTDDPTEQTFTVDIRGFSVVIVARATSFSWDAGDGTVLTTTDPGAPYPDQTITHDYASGTYATSLTTTWGATYSVDGGAQATVPGTTTTVGPAVTFTVLQARTVLTDPYD
jgi:hypothetical protein